VPGLGTVGWRYRIDALPPENQVREGPLEGVIAIPYRFDTPGVHRIRVELLGPGGSQIVEKPVVVVDSDSDFEILAQRSIDEIWPERQHMAPEGIVMDPAGRWLYAAMYSAGELVRIDPVTLGAVDRVVLGRQLEGLAIAPSGDRLFAIHKNHAGLSVVDLASFTSAHFDGFDGYYIVAMDESHALIGGNGILGRVNVDTREFERAPLSGGAGHFSVFPGGDRIVSVVYDPPSGVIERSSLEILSLPSLDPIRSIPLEELPDATHVAVDPSGDVMYAFGRGNSVRFLAIDPATGEVITSMSVDGSGCITYCVANPVVTFASGRYIAFEQGGAVIVVDTALDLPRYRFDPEGLGYDYDGPSGVAAHPDSDILYVLGPTGRLLKVRLRNP
jgi:DNA-binding beta-propeller fold protein YncE